MLSLSELKETLRCYNISPKKFLGQHFLIDKNIQEKIVLNSEITPQNIVIEIGPGLGALTEELCRRARYVYAIEKDKLFCEILRKRLRRFDNFKIINIDILRFNFSIDNFPTEKFKVIGNLPYYISTPILIHLIRNYQHISFIYITLQKELGQRITANLGSKDYGALTVFVNSYTKPEILFYIKRSCFYPIPEVDSCFLKIEVLDNPKFNLELEKEFFSTVRSVFQKRRKTVLNALLKSNLGFEKEELENILKKTKIDSQKRPETLSIEDFVNLTNHLFKHE